MPVGSHQDDTGDTGESRASHGELEGELEKLARRRKSGADLGK